MDDDSWAVVQVNRATVHDRGTDSIKWSIVTQVAGPAVLQPESWLSANVKQIVPGVLTVGAKKGAFAGELTIANVPVAITAVADPAGGTTFTHLKLSAHGMAEQIIDIDTAIGQIGGLRSQDWAGGGVPTPLHAGGGAATLADARVVSIPVEHFVGGGGSVAIKVAKLSLLNVAGPNVRCSTAATFLIGLTSASEVADALAATLATNQAGLASFSAANAGAAASPQATAMVQARGGLLQALGALLDAAPQSLLQATRAQLAAMAAVGMTPREGGVGAVVAAIIEAHPPEIAAVSPREAEILALRAALAATGAAAPAPALAGGLPPILPAPLPAPLAPASGPLVGMEVLRPQPPPGGAAATNADIFAAAGGRPVFEALATTAGRTSTIIIMSGPGADGTVEDAAADFEQLLAECLQGAPGDVRFCPSAPPLDLGEAASRIRSVLRQISRQRSETDAAAGAAEGSSRGGAKSAISKELKPMPKDQKNAERAMRACSAALLNPLCERPALLVSAQAGKLDDQLLEARRMIDLLGNPAAGYTLSNGEVTVHRRTPG